MEQSNANANSLDSISVSEPVSYEMAEENNRVKTITFTTIAFGNYQSDQLLGEMRKSLTDTIPFRFVDQMPGSQATAPDVRRWIKFWFTEHSLSTELVDEQINKLFWNGVYLHEYKETYMQTVLESVGIPHIYSAAIAHDIVVARKRVPMRYSPYVRFALDVCLKIIAMIIILQWLMICCAATLVTAMYFLVAYLLGLCFH